MSIFLNRSLDTLVSFAIVGLGLITAFATIAVAA